MWKCLTLSFPALELQCCLGSAREKCFQHFSVFLYIVLIIYQFSILCSCWGLALYVPQITSCVHFLYSQFVVVLTRCQAMVKTTSEHHSPLNSFVVKWI